MKMSDYARWQYIYGGATCHQGMGGVGPPLSAKVGLRMLFNEVDVVPSLVAAMSDALGREGLGVG